MHVTLHLFSDQKKTLNTQKQKIIKVKFICCGATVIRFCICKVEMVKYRNYKPHLITIKVFAKFKMFKNPNMRIFTEVYLDACEW